MITWLFLYHHLSVVSHMLEGLAVLGCSQRMQPALKYWKAGTGKVPWLLYIMS